MLTMATRQSWRCAAQSISFYQPRAMSRTHPPIGGFSRITMLLQYSMSQCQFRGRRSYHVYESSQRLKSPHHISNISWLHPQQSSSTWLSLLPFHQPVRTAGHSKWQNIRHIKAGKDAEKARIASYITRKIRVAIKEGGSIKPEANNQLARALEEGRSKDVPLTTMQQAIKKFEKSKDQASIIMLEAKGVGNCLLMIEVYTDNVKRTRTDLQGIIKKSGATIVKNGQASHSFEHRGVIEVTQLQKKPVEEGKETSEAGKTFQLSLDQATELAIEAGAEEVVEAEDEMGTAVYQFLSASTDLHSVKKELEGQGLVIHNAQLQYLPVRHVQLNDEALDIAGIMLDKILDYYDVVKVYHNIQATEKKS